MAVGVGLVRSLALAAILLAAVSWLVLRVHEGTMSSVLLATAASKSSWTRPDFASSSQHDELSSLSIHPLTYATREPYVPPPAPAVVAPPAPSYRLAGTLITPGKPASALLTPPAGDANARRVKPGDDVDGWRVHAIEVNRVVLKYGDQSIEIAKSSGSGESGGITRAIVGTRSGPSSAGTLSAEGKLLSAAGSPGAQNAAPRGKAALFESPRPYIPPPQ